MKQPSVLALLAAAMLVLAAACGGERESRSITVQIATGTATATATAVACTTAATPAGEGGEPEPVASTASIPVEQLGVMEFHRQSDGQIVVLPVEVPPRTEYSIGLSGRRELCERGMLFHYPEDTRGPFWMKNTHIDLSIAFVDREARVVEIRRMTAESLELVRPEVDYRFAVEAPAGWYAEHGIETGDLMRTRFEFTPGE
ncbi:MAG: DUF192 domain-containing protein [Dehalococcoidia bacterium]